jgi:ubiquinone/menaquinone biosynthesis C-methylase UbiE
MLLVAEACVNPGPTEFNQAGREAWVASAAKRLPAGTRVLDVGAGECRYRALFAHCNYKAHDFCQYRGADGASRPGTWQYGAIDYVSDATTVPVPDGSFDAVLCTEVLEHVPEPILVIRELGRILKPGGTLFLSAPLGSGLHQQPYHYYGGFTPHFYRKFLSQFGFEIVSIQPNGGFFRHLAQNLAWAASAIQSRRNYSRWHPAYWLLKRGLRKHLPGWLMRLDDEYLIEDFTVGFHVEARKPTGPTSPEVP